VGRIRKGVSQIRAGPAVAAARRVLGRSDEGYPRRPQRRQNHVGARQRVFRQGRAKEHGGFGKLLAKWPSSDQIGLLEFLARRGSRLGGNTGQMLLRFIGWDGFVMSKDVGACLRDAGLDVAQTITSKRDLAKVQAQFNAWAEETGLPYSHLSRICAMSIGENYGTDTLARFVGGEE
jgi:hypothetical protein